MLNYVFEFKNGIEITVEAVDFSAAEDRLLEMGFASRDIAKAQVRIGDMIE